MPVQTAPASPTPHPGGTRLALASLLLALAAGAGPARAERLPVLLDGFPGEWTAVSPAWTDASGDAGPSGIDLGRLWVADDAQYLYLRFEVGTDLLLNDGNNLNLALDTDDDAATGLALNGIGAELVWRPGQKSGSFYPAGSMVSVQWNDCGFIGMPTVSATEFEVAFLRASLPDGSHPLFPAGAGGTIRVFLRESAPGGDWLPDSGTTLSYQLDQGAPLTETPVPLVRERATDLRVITWNVLSDGPWNGTLQPKFRRQVQAVAPDVISLQEIYNHTPEVTRQLVASWLPGTWYAAGNHDCITVSRYPVLGSWALDGNLGVLLDTDLALGKQTLVINVHLPCCTDDAGRQREIDRILSFMRDALSAGGQLDLPVGTAIVFMGDTNLVGAGSVRSSLLAGNIADNGTFGPDFAPDWDGTALADLVSRQTERRLCLTWQSATSAFWPGRLDYIVYNDSSVQPGNHFVLDPSQMSADSLAAHGLLASDSGASDHRLHCVDLRVGTAGDTTPAPTDPGTRLRGHLLQNPTGGRTRLAFSVGRPTTLRMTLLDVDGHRIAEPFAGEREYPPGSWSLAVEGVDADGHALPPGVYFLRLDGRDDAGAVSQTLKWVVIR